MMRPGYLCAFAVSVSFFGGYALHEPGIGSLFLSALLMPVAGLALCRLAVIAAESAGWRLGFERRDSIEKPSPHPKEA